MAKAISPQGAEPAPFPTLNPVEISRLKIKQRKVFRPVCYEVFPFRVSRARSGQLMCVYMCVCVCVCVSAAGKGEDDLIARQFEAMMSFPPSRDTSGPKQTRCVSYFWSKPC